MKVTTSANSPIVVGQISGVFGVHGWVKVFSHTEPRNNILSYDPWLIKGKQGWISMSFLQGRKQGKTLVAQLKDINDRDKAQALTGCDIAINEDQLKTLAKNDYYWRDLTGLVVESQVDGRLGVVKEMMATGANDVVVVKLDQVKAEECGEKEILIPYLLGDAITEVDLEKGTMKVNWPEWSDSND